MKDGTICIELSVSLIPSSRRLKKTLNETNFKLTRNNKKTHFVILKAHSLKKVSLCRLLLLAQPCCGKWILHTADASEWFFCIVFAAKTHYAKRRPAATSAASGWWLSSNVVVNVTFVTSRQFPLSDFKLSGGNCISWACDLVTWAASSTVLWEARIAHRAVNVTSPHNKSFKGTSKRQVKMPAAGKSE